MERNCTTTTGNVYFECRKQSALYNDRLNSRESTAELLGISPSSLANYELGVTKIVPPDAVVMMSDLYNAPELKAHYCANECPIGKGANISTKASSLESATIKIIDALSREDTDINLKMLVSIVKDGIISGDEEDDLAKVLQYLDRLSYTISELKLSCQKVLATQSK